MSLFYHVHTDNEIMYCIKKVLLTIFQVYFVIQLHAYAPVLNEDDIYFEKSDTGYELFIRKKDNIGSILLTESQKTGDGSYTNYGLRTENYFDANSDEIRILDNKILHTKYDAYFLVDSTTEKHPILGDSFRFFLPEKVIYGYDWSRKGELFIKNGIQINARLFEKPYSDYSGEFKDQWITLTLKTSNINFRPKLISDMNRIVPVTGGKVYIKNNNDTIETIFKKIIPDYTNISSKMDIIFLIDTTISMYEEFPAFVKNFPDMVKKLQLKIKNLRIGFIFYRDYGEKFVTRTFDLTDDMNYVTDNLKRIKIEGGQDIPEALNEALFELKNVHFEKDARRTAFIIADAPAHSEPRGAVTEEMAINVLSECNIKLNAICLPFQ